jgi:hypothetical protein
VLVAKLRAEEIPKGMEPCFKKFKNEYDPFLVEEVF